jgi:hypothetical protein
LLFAFLILLSWLNELISLPHLMFQSDEHSNLHEASHGDDPIDYGVVHQSHPEPPLLFGGVLESLCWCRRIGHDDEWIPLENLDKQFAAKTSHGTCPDCQKKLVAETQAVA